jgi:Tfp pilus assembly protein PilV
MTLLEALVGLVILGLSSVGFLGFFQAASRSATDAESWTRAVAIAQETMERTKLGAGASDGVAQVPTGFHRQVTVVPWQSGLSEVIVTVTLPNGRVFMLRRIARGP